MWQLKLMKGSQERQIQKLRNKFFFKGLFRTSKPITFLLGTQYTPSLKHIEIDITYHCNLKCYNCDRSCNQAPTKISMTVKQLEKFIEESERSKKFWKRIRLLGGEPLLHENIQEILEIFSNYKQKHSQTLIELVTNGYGKDIDEKINQIPKNIAVKNTKKLTRLNKKFEPFNVAPIDIVPKSIISYSNGCWITAYCGIGLNMFGYYPCGVSGSIDRVMGFNKGLKNLPSDINIIKEQLKYFCRYCGNFLNRKYLKPENRLQVIGEPKTKSWREAYKHYNKSPQILKSY